MTSDAVEYAVGPVEEVQLELVGEGDEVLVEIESVWPRPTCHMSAYAWVDDVRLE
jgi:hypothetical protein